jgi:hypothetical protein
MIAEGRYQARATEHEFGQSKSATRFVRVQFEIKTEGEFHGHAIHWDGFFTEKTAERTMDSLEHCGWDGASLTALTGLGSKDCSITVEHEEYTDAQGNTKKYPKVAWVNKLGGSKLKDDAKLDAGGIKSLEQEFKASLMERRQKNGSKPATQGNGSTPRGTSRVGNYNPDFGPMPSDDDIPF